MNYRNAYVFLGLVVSLLATTCAPYGTSQRPDWTQGLTHEEEPNGSHLFHPCNGIESKNPGLRAFAAMILSLQEREWIVQSMDPGLKKIEGKKCWRTRPSLCVRMNFEADGWGRIKATEQYVEAELRDDLERWFGELEQTFSKYRCYTNDALASEMQKYGISM